MPGYGILGPTQGRGLLPWAWAEERLTSSYRYWVGSVGPDGCPHAMPVWGVWHLGAFWFSTGGRSRKARNLRADPRCVVHTDDAGEPVVIEGTAEAMREVGQLAAMLERYAAKYPMPPPDADENPIFRVAPRWAFAVIEAGEEFAGSATRWDFAD